MSEIFDALSQGGGAIADILSRIDRISPPPPSPASSTSPSSPAASPAPAAARPASGMVATATDETYPTVKINAHVQSPILLFSHEYSRAAEQYRIIRTKLTQHPLRPSAITVSSGSPNDGKTFNAINLAAMLSLKKNTPVILIDADMRQSGVARQLGLDDRLGLSDVLAGQCSLADAIFHIDGYPNLYIMTAGQTVQRPVELLDSGAWRRLVAQFRKTYRFVMVDAPPIAIVADYDLIQEPCDGVVLIVRQDHTPRTILQNAIAAIPEDKLIGVIMNRSQDWMFSKRQGSYYYYDHYHRKEQ